MQNGVLELALLIAATAGGVIAAIFAAIAAPLTVVLAGQMLRGKTDIHTFNVRERAGTTFVNTCALDRILPVASKRDRRRVRYVNAGNYAVVDRKGKVSAQCRLLHRNW